MANKFTSYVFDKDLNMFVPISTSESPDGALYGDFIDAPIKNAHGASRYSYVDVSKLDYATYNVTGYYRLDGDSPVETTSPAYITMYVTKDIDSAKKVVTFQTVANEIVYNNIVVYDSEGHIERNIVTQANTIYWEPFDETNEKEVLFVRLTQAEYTPLAKSNTTFYYLTDTNQLYLGEELLNNIPAINAAVARIAALEVLTAKLDGDDTVIDSVSNKIKNAINALTGSATIATQMGKMITIKSGITEANGIMSNNSGADIMLADVAATGAAADVYIADSYENLDSHNVEDALAEIVGMVNDTHSDSVIYMAHESGTLLYTLYQGSQDVAHKIGEINIPVDMVATSGQLYVATAADTDLVEGDTYIKMTIANGAPFYIPVQELIDVYVGTNVQTGIQINVVDGVISATIRTLDGALLDSQSVSKAALSSGVQASLDKADSAIQSVVEGTANGTIKVDNQSVNVHGLGTAAYQNVAAFDPANSAETVRTQLMGNASTDTVNSKTIEGLTKRIDTAVDNLDGSAVIASKTGTLVTLKRGIVQSNGIVSNNTDDNIELAGVATTGVAADVRITDQGGLIEANNVETALQEIMTKLNQILDILTWHDIPG